MIDNLAKIIFCYSFIIFLKVHSKPLPQIEYNDVFLSPEQFKKMIDSRNDEGDSSSVTASTTATIESSAWNPSDSAEIKTTIITILNRGFFQTPCRRGRLRVGLKCNEDFS